MPSDLTYFDQPAFKKDLKFTSQPNMIFEINPSWDHEDDYVKALTKNIGINIKEAGIKPSVFKKKIKLGGNSGPTRNHL